ncbi:MAG: DUF4876 domain-containing protein [Prevotella sp.]|nr:DUF4876 domain-containing protein [Prevotella sp.]
MRKILLLIGCACLLTGCVDFNDTASSIDITVQMERPENFLPTADLSGFAVTIQSKTDRMTALTDANGQVVFTDMVPNTYNISVDADITARYHDYTGQSLDGKEKFTLSGTLNEQAVAQSTLLSLRPTTFRKATLIIGKAYISGSKESTGNKAYDAGKYIEIYNNSDEAVDAAGLYVGLTESESTIAYQVYPYESAPTPGIIHLKQVFRIPTSTPVIVQPGSTLLLVNSAFDHSAHNEFERDLRDADFEAKDNNGRTPNNTATPALELIYSCYSALTYMNLVQGGPCGIVIFRTGEDVSTWPTVYAYGKERGTLFMEMQATYAMDGVDIIKNTAGTGPNINTKRLFDIIDAGYTFENAPAGRTGERLVRKTASVTADGRKVLQDTNNSLNDFVINSTLDPRAYLEPDNN